MAQHELSWSQGKILEYLQTVEHGNTVDSNTELANKLALGYGSTVNKALQKLEKYKLITISQVMSSRKIQITELGKRHLVIDEELKGNLLT